MIEAESTSTSGKQHKGKQDIPASQTIIDDKPARPARMLSSWQIPAVILAILLSCATLFLVAWPYLTYYLNTNRPVPVEEQIKGLSAQLDELADAQSAFLMAWEKQSQQAGERAEALGTEMALLTDRLGGVEQQLTLLEEEVAVLRLPQAIEPEVFEPQAETVPEIVPEIVPETASASTPEIVPETNSAITTEIVPEIVPETDSAITPEIVPETDSAITPEIVQETTSTSTPENTSETAPETVSAITPKIVPETDSASTPETAPKTDLASAPEIVPTTTPEIASAITPEIVPETVSAITPEIVPTTTPEIAPENPSGGTEGEERSFFGSITNWLSGLVSIKRIEQGQTN